MSDENNTKENTDEGGDEVVFEEIDDEINMQAKLKSLREKLKQSETEKQEYLTNLQKAKADFINLRKRDEQDKEAYAKFANQDLINEILPVLDSFENALNSKHEGAEGWKSGFESLHNQLFNALNKYGVKKLYPLGEQFDPRFHEAIGTVATTNKDEDHKVLEVFQTGYTLNDRVVRTAKVKVGEYSE